jgi:hypothetical protein
MENWNVKIIDKGIRIERDIYIYRKLGDKIEIIGAGNTTNIINQFATIPDEPTLSLNPEALQAFANALNDIGINPQKEFIEGKLEATEKHLEDMRTLVFKRIK